MAAAALAVVRDRHGQLILIRRAQRKGDPWAGQLGFPGGRLQTGESPLNAAVREAAEEVPGLDLRDERVFPEGGRARGVYHVHSIYDMVPFDVHVFEFTAATDLPPLRRRPEEVAELLYAHVQQFQAPVWTHRDVHVRDIPLLSRILPARLLCARYPAMFLNHAPDLLLWGLTLEIVMDVLDAPDRALVHRLNDRGRRHLKALTAARYYLGGSRGYGKPRSRF